MRIHVLASVAALLCCAGTGAVAAETAAPPADSVGIALEGFSYPHPVSYLPVTLSGEALRMAYMDVPPSGPANGRTALLFHGRNFPASYWEPVIKALAGAGYRVVVPDQIGFGKSSKPAGPVSFDDLARNNAALLEGLGVKSVDLVAHSMGGMLAVRFTRAYPDRVDRLVLEAPIGLEDYRLAVPPVTTERLMEGERNLTADGYRKQLITNYAVKSPDGIEPFVALRERVKASGEYERWLRSFVGSYQTIYREPVVHEIPLIAKPTLFVMGANDHNAPGKPFAPPDLQGGMGQNARHATELAARMPTAKAIVFEGAGHLVHMDETDRFNQTMLGFLGGS